LRGLSAKGFTKYAAAEIIILPERRPALLLLPMQIHCLSHISCN